MDPSVLLKDLNDKQREAVSAEVGHHLVLAGAGSGKTRVLVHRIAYLIQVFGVSPFSILAVTFTNKAANSMRSRIQDLLDFQTEGMWVGTFHGLCHRLLRMHWREANLDQTFQIIDSDDQLRMIKRQIKELNIDENYWPPKKAQGFINRQKENGIRANAVKEANELYTQTLTRIYQAYEVACERARVIDFTELMLRVYEMWQRHPEILEQYRKRFRHILVDEFQDTNELQYRWLCLLAGDSGFLTMVGDDDQSIYRWRGAQGNQNLEKFLKTFDVAIFKLEENYRSTEIILSAANAVIANNSERLGKQLWTQAEKGSPILLYAAFNEIDEARFIAGKIRSWFEQGMSYDEVAVLYRSNAQSRVIEEALIQQGIPYRVYGGLRFFERAEIKDALAYLKLLSNSSDDAAFERIINTPTRGIGERTLELLRSHAKENSISLWDASQSPDLFNVLSGRALSALRKFIELIESLKTEIENLALHEQVQLVIEKSGLVECYQKERDEKSRTRLENLFELVSAAREFSVDEGMNGSPLSIFLAHTALEAGEDDRQAGNGTAVQLMTIHSAKGLEFPYVFLSGVEEGLFPHPMSSQEIIGLEEERRLCYVGITRAQTQLVLSYAEVRRLHGQERMHRRSRFIEEIPENLIEDVRPRKVVIRPRFNEGNLESLKMQTTLSNGLKIGQRVRHPKFGEGVILQSEGNGSHARVQVNFSDVGSKWLIEAYAKLETAD